MVFDIDLNPTSKSYPNLNVQKSSFLSIFEVLGIDNFFSLKNLTQVLLCLMQMSLKLREFHKLVTPCGVFNLLDKMGFLFGKMA